MYHSQNEPVTFVRECPAVLITAGERVTLPAGSTGFLTQALGGSFTIYIEGNLFRIAGSDGDAIGKAPLSAPDIPGVPTCTRTESAESRIRVWRYRAGPA